MRGNVRIGSVDAEFTRAVLTRNLAYSSIHTGAAESLRQHLAEEREPALGSRDRISVGLHMIDDQGSLMVGRGASPGFADQGLEPLLPACLCGGSEAGEAGVTLSEGNRRGGAVQPQRGSDPARLRQAQQLDPEVKVPGRTQRFVLANNGQRP
jgi:hypothetical protein